jgi:hypothetical protein
MAKGLVIELDAGEAHDAPYRGRAGATRIETVHVPVEGGTLRTVTVHRAINVATDPELRDAALDGALHRLDGGTELAIPFVYHDPGRRVFALVVPEALRHEELRERARLLEALASETALPIPRYVRDATTVIGLAQLRELVARPSRGPDGHVEDGERERAIVQREETLAKREQRMRERAEDVTRREDELASATEIHEAAQRDLAMREQELERRLESVIQREKAIDELPIAEAIRVSDGPSPPSRRSRAAKAEGAAPIASPSVAHALAPARVPVVEPIAEGEVESAEVEDVEELDDLEPIATDPGTRRAIVADVDQIASVDDSAVEERPDSEEPEPSSAEALSVEEIVDDDDVEEEVDDGDVASEEASGKTTVGKQRALVEPVAEREAQSEPPGATGILRPAELVGQQMIARLGDGVELFIALEDQKGAFVGECDLLLQLAIVDGCPVVVLALIDPTGPHPVVRRAVIDPRGADDRRILESLRRRFEAKTLFFDGEGRLVRTARVAAPRELNAARVVDRVSRMRVDPAADVATAIARVRSTPPPAFGGHPFAAEEEPSRFDTAAGSAAALAELAEWSAPDKMDHALLVLSVPRDVIDATFARVLERAVEHGLALPVALVDRALGAGLAPDARALAQRQLAAFRATVALPDRGGLGDEAVCANWESLLAAAADTEIAVDAETHDLAWRSIRAVRGETTGALAGGAVDPSRLDAMGVPELVMLLERPRHRRAAALALCERGDPALAETLSKAVRKMPRNEVVRVVPRITKLGDEAGDALIDGLGARKTFARQAFALALGHLKLRRAVVPLLHLLGSEPSDIWKEVARVYGTFGNASFRTLSQKLHDSKAPEQRFVLALAHLANHGCEKQVDALEKDSEPRIAGIARAASRLRDEARRQEEIVLGKRPLDGNDALLAFSRRFVEELEGTAPDTDLAAPPGEEEG